MHLSDIGLKKLKKIIIRSKIICVSSVSCKMIHISKINSENVSNTRKATVNPVI